MTDEPTQERMQELWRLEQEAKAEALALVLPAFSGLFFTPAELGISGGDQEVKIELSQFLVDTFTDRKSLTVTVQQSVFVELGTRLKQVAEQLQGGTWSGG